MDVLQLSVEVARKTSKHQAPVVEFVPLLALVPTHVITIENERNSEHWFFTNSTTPIAR